MLAMLKADFSVIETYQPLGELEGDGKKEKTMMKLPASIRLVVFGGEDDIRYTGEQLQAWKELCSSSDQWGGIHWFSGDHHFYNQNQSREMVVQCINHHLFSFINSVDLGGFGSPVVEDSTVDIESVNKGMASPSPFEMNRDNDDRKEEREEEEDRSGGRVKASASVPRPKLGCVYLRRRWCF